MMNNYTKTCVLIFCCLFAIIRPLQGQTNFAFKGKKQKDFISFTKARQLIVVTTFINDKGPFNFILDTGSNNSIVVSKPSVIDTNKTTEKQVMLGASFSAFGNVIDTTYTYKMDNLFYINNIKIDTVIIHQKNKKKSSYPNPVLINEF